MRRKPGLRPDLPGFSLIELTMVIAIVAIVAAIAVPRYVSALSNYRSDAATRRLTIELESAAARAQAVSATVAVRFEPANERIVVTAPRSDLTIETLTVVDLDATPYETDLQSTTFVDDTLRFDGFGRPESGGEVVLRSGDSVMRVRVNSASGEITVE